LLLQKFKAINAEHLGSFGDLTVDGKKVALYHGTDAPITVALEKCGMYDVVISGHTHRKKVEKVGSMLAINPGTAHGFEGMATSAFWDSKSMEVEFVELG